MFWYWRHSLEHHHDPELWLCALCRGLHLKVSIKLTRITLGRSQLRAVLIQPNDKFKSCRWLREEVSGCYCQQFTGELWTYTAGRSPRRPVSALGLWASAAPTRVSSTYTPVAAPPWPPDKRTHQNTCTHITGDFRLCRNTNNVSTTMHVSPPTISGDKQRTVMIHLHRRIIYYPSASVWVSYSRPPYLFGLNIPH